MGRSRPQNRFFRNTVCWPRYYGLSVATLCAQADEFAGVFALWRAFNRFRNLLATRRTSMTSFHECALDHIWIATMMKVSVLTFHAAPVIAPPLLPIQSIGGTNLQRPSFSRRCVLLPGGLWRCRNQGKGILRFITCGTAEGTGVQTWIMFPPTLEHVMA